MTKTVAEEHPELCHYTNATGLCGILNSQQLHATNIAYLNDAEEYIGFFDRRLPMILDDSVRKAVTELARTSKGKAAIEKAGALDKAVGDLKEALSESILTTALGLGEPYVTAFCRVKDQHTLSDGLLSQWRGYGVNGGYAIVFRAKGLEKLLRAEWENFHYQFLKFGDVDYDDQGTNKVEVHPERENWEEMIQRSVRDFIVARKREGFEPLSEAIPSLSTRYKHHGFREEAEVRIVAIPSNDAIFKIANSEGDTRPKKAVQFTPRNGVLRPFIKLFWGNTDGIIQKLPISRIIVGPHSDKLKRQKAIELMLQQNGIEAQVTVSDIPYLGR